MPDENEEEEEIEQTEEEKEIKKPEKKTKQTRGKGGKFGKKEKEVEVIKEDSDDTVEILKETLEKLQKKHKDLDLSHLSVNDQIKTFRAMDKTPKKKTTKKKTEPPAGQNPMKTPAVPEDTYVPLSVRNERKSFMKRLNPFRTKGGDIDVKLGFKKK